MGQRRKKRLRFLQAHPTCCFCGGSSASVTIDHVPNRASFQKRLGPEGFEFPACDRCQTSTRFDELAFSMMVHLCGNDGSYDQQQFAKLLDGIKNNLPELLPDLRLSSVEKRKRLRSLGIPKPTSKSLADLPIAGIPPDYHPRISRYVHKIILALYYRHLLRIAPANRTLWAMWATGQGSNLNDAIASWSEITPILDVGKRANVDIGDGFRARLNYSEDMDAFVTIGQFGDGLIFFGSCLTAEVAARVTPYMTDQFMTRSPGDWSD